MRKLRRDRADAVATVSLLSDCVCTKNFIRVDEVTESPKLAQ
jgi:hypothetical protein